jgi:hypothetical protein
VNPNQLSLLEDAVTDTDYKTVGVDPKVPIQAVVTVAVWLLAYFGVDLTPEVSTAISVLLGVIAGALSPAPKTVVKSS